MMVSVDVAARDVRVERHRVTYKQQGNEESRNKW